MRYIRGESCEGRGVLRGRYPYLFEGLVTSIYLSVTCGLIDCNVIVSERKEGRSYGRREGIKEERKEGEIKGVLKCAYIDFKSTRKKVKSCYLPLK